MSSHTSTDEMYSTPSFTLSPQRMNPSPVKLERRSVSDSSDTERTPSSVDAEPAAPKCAVNECQARVVTVRERSAPSLFLSAPLLA